jgi:hypothetical protein
MLRRFCAAAVATSREGHRSPRSDLGDHHSHDATPHRCGCGAIAVSAIFWTTASRSTFDLGSAAASLILISVMTRRLNSALWQVPSPSGHRRAGGARLHHAASLRRADVNESAKCAHLIFGPRTYSRIPQPLRTRCPKNHGVSKSKSVTAVTSSEVGSDHATRAVDTEAPRTPYGFPVAAEAGRP